MSSVGDTQKRLIEDAQKKFAEIQGEMIDLQNKVSAQSRVVGSVGSLGDPSSSVHEKKKSVLEYNVIKDYPVLGEDKRHFREWHYKLKANLKAVLGHSCNITKWMDIAEKDACSVKKESEQDPFPEVGVGRSEAAADIEAIMINKLQEGS
jgi:hypothetical protein